MAKFIIETKGNQVTRNNLLVALVYDFGLDVIVSVENASQQSFAPDVCKRCGDTGRAEPTLSDPDGVECPDCTRR